MAKNDIVDFSVIIDDRQTKAAIKTMQTTSADIMANAIFKVLKNQIGQTQSQIKRDSGVRQHAMAQKVADSLIVEIGENHNSKAEVRFGSDPIDSGGVTGSRGGKLAQLLEYGAPRFDYPFTFKSIKNSTSFGGGAGSGGFINTKGGNNTVHPGFKSIDWLSKARDRSAVEIEGAIIKAFNDAWGGGRGNSNYN
tara:strand:+ start:40 stop:621 length:582 start_codon:yes stop_codon:yes gene_type:complete